MAITGPTMRQFDVKEAIRFERAELATEVAVAGEVLVTDAQHGDFSRSGVTFAVLVGHSDECSVM